MRLSSRAMLAPHSAQEGAARTTLATGDFFASVPAGGDAYLLSNILHDWDDERSRRILVNCREAMAPGGRVLLVEAVLPGSESRAKAQSGFSRNLGDPVAPSR